MVVMAMPIVAVIVVLMVMVVVVARFLYAGSAAEQEWCVHATMSKLPNADACNLLLYTFF
jgi:hypothetical protein